MIDLFGGTVFDVGRANVSTQGLSLDNYLNKMGVSRFGEVEFDPVAATSKGLSIDESGSYFNALSELNSFGLSMASKGIDVFDPKSDQGRIAAKAMQEMSKRVNQNLSGLVASQQLKKDISQRMLTDPTSRNTDKPVDRLAVSDDLFNVKTAKDLISRMDALVKEGQSNFAKEFEDQQLVDDANKSIDGIKDELLTFEDELVARGYDRKEARAMTRQYESLLGQASLKYRNPLDDELKKARINAANRSNRTGKDEKPVDERVSEIKELIGRIQNFDDQALGVLEGKKASKDASVNDVIVNAKFVGKGVNPGQAKIQLQLADGSIQEMELSNQNGNGFGSLFSILSKDFDLTIDDLDGDFNTNIQQSAIGPVAPTDKIADPGNTSSGSRKSKFLDALNSK